MSSTLCFRPQTAMRWSFRLPVKGIFAKRFYGHDGTLGGDMQILGPQHLSWLEGVIAAGSFDADDERNLAHMADCLRQGQILEMWFEH